MQQDEQLDLANHNGADHDHQEECGCGSDCCQNDGAECGCNCEDLAPCCQGGPDSDSNEAFAMGDEITEQAFQQLLPPQPVYAPEEVSKVLALPHISMPVDGPDVRVVAVGTIPTDLDLNAWIDENLLETPEQVGPFTHIFKEGPLRFFRLPVRVLENRDELQHFIFDHPSLEAFLREGLKMAEYQLRTQWEAQSKTMGPCTEYVQPQLTAHQTAAANYASFNDKVLALVKNPDTHTDALKALIDEEHLANADWRVSAYPDYSGFSAGFVIGGSGNNYISLSVSRGTDGWVIDIYKELNGDGVALVSEGVAEEYLSGVVALIEEHYVSPADELFKAAKSPELLVADVHDYFAKGVVLTEEAVKLLGGNSQDKGTDFKVDFVEETNDVSVIINIGGWHHVIFFQPESFGWNASFEVGEEGNDECGVPFVGKVDDLFVGLAEVLGVTVPA